MKEIVKQDIYVNVIFDFFFQNLLAGTLPATLAHSREFWSPNLKFQISTLGGVVCFSPSPSLT